MFAVWRVLSTFLHDSYLIKKGLVIKLLNVCCWCRFRFNFLFTNIHLFGLEVDLPVHNPCTAWNQL